MKNSGFSLSEVLITLTIIGVVSAMVVPQLIANYENKAYAATLHKAYNNIGYAIEQYMAQQRVDNLKESELANNSAKLGEFVDTYFKSATINCSGNGSGGCFIAEKTNDGRKTPYCKYDNKNTQITIACDKAIKTVDGIAYCFKVTEQSGDNVIGINIDLNGPDDPNMLGRDLFMGIKIDKNGFITTEDTDAGNMVKNIIEKNWKIDY